MIPLPASLFQNHAVLQRDTDLPVWGRVKPFALVEVRLDEQVAVRGLSNASGDFLVRLPPQPAGGPHTLSIRDLYSGEETRLHDILIGEVWLASGQSNMEWTLGLLGENADADLADTDLHEVRMFTVTRRASLGPQSDLDGSWLPFSPAHNADHSAAAFYFARKLHQHLGLPVGVISSAWGGSIIEAWTPRSVLASYAPVRTWLLEAERESETVDRWPVDQPALPPPPPISNLPPLPALDTRFASPGMADSSWPRMQLPRTWQTDGHLFSGVFWFRRVIELPPAWIGRDLSLGIGAADKQDITFVNGVEVDRTGKDYESGSWNLPRHYTVPAVLTQEGRLLIAIRVFSFLYDGGLIGPAEEMRITCEEAGGEPLSLAGDWAYHIEHNFGLLVGDTRPGHGRHNSPHMLFDNMIRPLLPYAIRGALWYQGESNTSQAGHYAPLLGGMIQAWRTHWDQGDFPFLIVQLPAFMAPKSYDANSSWARLRKAQLEVTRRLPAVHLTVNLDLGDAVDIHPRRKAPVGERLAALVLSELHGEWPATGGPLPQDLRVDGDSIVVTFDRAEGGLRTSDGAAPTPLVLLDTSGTAHPACGELEGNRMRVRSATLTQPCGIAYAWADNPLGANLVDARGLPASPFRVYPLA